MKERKDPSSSAGEAAMTERKEHDVFLSFRGKDTHGRGDFVGHLDDALKRAVIHTFFANETLQIGRDISSGLLKAIESSNIAVVVLSENFPSSRWCLDELMKILQCKNDMELTVMPVFYYVAPSDVRRLNGSLRDAFNEASSKAVSDGMPEKVEKWKKALEDAGKLLGFVLPGSMSEEKMIKKIVREISKKVSNAFSNIESDKVGIDERARVVLEKLKIGSKGVRTVGIWGMDGIGKTTLAWFLYEKLRQQFSASSFLADVGKVCQRDGGVVTLQNQVLTETLGDIDVTVFNNYVGRREICARLKQLDVLLVLDDINKQEQLRDIFGSLDYVGSKSRVIITTTDKHLLNANRVKSIYEMELLDECQARTLFKKHAILGPEMAVEEYESLSEEVVRYCGGIPLALKVLGSYFATRGPKAWRSDLDQLKKTPHADILARLKISYDGLNDEQKRAFLYVSCIFQGSSEERVVFMLDCLGLYPESILEVLEERCLVKLSGGFVGMHDKLQELGRHIIQKQRAVKSPILLSTEDIQNLLNQNVGTAATESIVLHLRRDERSLMRFNLNGFSNFTKLKLLMIIGVEANFSGSLECLSNELRYLRWDSCPLKSLPSDTHLPLLRGLVLPSCSIQYLRSGGEVIKVAPFLTYSGAHFSADEQFFFLAFHDELFVQRFAKLEAIQLSECKDLTDIPNLSYMQDLRTLDLRGCIRLVEVRLSTPLHEKLQHLNLKGCTSLKHVPDAIFFPSLILFTLSGCSSLENFPHIRGRMEHLRQLHVDGTAITELPPSIKFLVGLKYIHANNCKNLRNLPNCISDLNCLRFLDLRDCPNLTDLPPNLVNLERVRLRRVREEQGPFEDIKDDALAREIPNTTNQDTSLEDKQGCSCSIS